MQNPEKCISRETILQSVWNYSAVSITLDDHKLLNTHISTIRKVLKAVDPQLAKCIVTEHAYGYRLGKDYFAKD
jgi:DNA-binding winged helix-turn-helix (wHTH) protein